MSREPPPRPPPEDWSRMEEVLDRALGSEPSEWPALLDEAFRGDQPLRRAVANLLARRDSLGDFLQSIPVEVGLDLAASNPEEDAFLGRRIGPYRIVAELGRGGMGWVFEAERADGLFRRTVALKLLRPSLADGEARARFEAERRILARLDHPSMARLIDAGTTAEGRPYLVTEFVRGVPLDIYCRERKLGLEARLELFRQVADAVQHAHQNLLVHRDLKPSNILVTPEGRIKLLDFGIAKLLTTLEDGGPAPSTQSGRLWMTPPYAAPEQISGEAATTAVDVYQLGVLLYELLAGRRPFHDRENRLPLIHQAILFEDPPPPSATARTSPDAVSPRELTEDLDAIVLKALRKRPQNRYSSPRAMVDDLERQAEGRPVEARRHTHRYRLGRFLRRHRLEAGAAVAVGLSLLVGTATAAWQAGEAGRERDEAREARAQADAALTESRELTRALLELVTAPDPWDGSLRGASQAMELLALGRSRVQDLTDHPLAQAEILDALARVHLNLDRMAEADSLAATATRLRRQVHGGDHLEVAHSLNTVGLVRSRQGRYAESDSLHREALRIQEAHLGPNHPEVANTLSLSARRMFGGGLQEPERLYRRALQIRRQTLGEEHPAVASSLGDLGRVLRAQGRHQESRAAFQEAKRITEAAFGTRHVQVARVQLSLADLLRQMGSDLEAEALYRSAFEILENNLGRDYPGLTHPLESLARIHAERGEDEQAESLLRAGLELRLHAFGPDHRSVALGLGVLAQELHRQGRLDEAEELRRQEISLSERTAGPDHVDTGGAVAGLADLLADRGELDEAMALYARVLEIRRGAHGDRHGGVGLALSGLARIHAAAGDPDQAQALYREALDILLEERTEDHPDVRAIQEALAALHVRFPALAAYAPMEGPGRR
jgi:eukaryotic-like serine/threonine-protein kinase